MPANANNVEIAKVQHQLQAAQKGDMSAFGELVERYHRLVVHVAYRICSDADLADDVAQDTFLQAWQRLAEFQPQRNTSLQAWLCRIAHNRTVDILRQSRPQAELGSWLPARTPLPDTLAEQNETAIEIQAAIMLLPEKSRTALILREYEDLSYAEIAEVLEIPIGTVMSRLYNARKRLVEELTPLMLEIEQ